MDHWHEFIPDGHGGCGWAMYDSDGNFEAYQDCSIPNNPNYCPYASEGRYHRHHVYYILHGDDGGYHNQWHVGGGGTGE